MPAAGATLGCVETPTTLTSLSLSLSSLSMMMGDSAFMVLALQPPSYRRGVVDPRAVCVASRLTRDRRRRAGPTRPCGARPRLVHVCDGANPSRESLTPSRGPRALVPGRSQARGGGPSLQIC